MNPESRFSRFFGKFRTQKLIDPKKALNNETKKITNSKNMGEKANKGFTRDDSSTNTRLLDKHWSPLIVRKYQKEGWPMFVGIICDANLDDLDSKVNEISEEGKQFLDGGIQGVRNFCGFLSDELFKHYDSQKKGCLEGLAVLWYVDKMFCSSLFGDFMVHASCKQELFGIINTLPHV